MESYGWRGQVISSLGMVGLAQAELRDPSTELLPPGARGCDHH